MLLPRRVFSILSLYLCLPNGLYTFMSPDKLDAYNITYIFEFIKNINIRHSFDSLVSYSAHRRLAKTDTHGQVIRSLDRTLLEDIKVPIVIWSLQSNVSLRNILISNTLVYAGITHFAADKEPLLHTMLKTLDGRHDVRILFILRTIKDYPADKGRLIQFFKWCWKRKFLNVAVTFQWNSKSSGNRTTMHNELFSYTPFPKVKLMNVTSLGVNFPWFNQDVSNVRGYIFHLPVYQNIPNAFLVSLTKVGIQKKNQKTLFPIFTKRNLRSTSFYRLKGRGKTIIQSLKKN